MSKRKRSRSSDDGRNGRECSAEHGVNPFLPVTEQEPSPASRKRSEILEHAVAFDEQFSGASKASLSSECQAHAAALLGYLEDEVSDEEMDPLLVEVALLVLPWTIQLILSSKPSLGAAARWKGLLVCLRRIFATDDPGIRQSLSQTHLSQSKLHRLVPCLTTAALAGDETTTAESAVEVAPASGAVASAALQALQLLLPVYRPSVEVACQSLLPLLAEARPPRPAVARAVLDWIAATMRVANPRTVFQTVSSPGALLALSKIYFGPRLDAAHEDERGSGLKNADRDDAPVQAAIARILSMGLFDPRHHLEGLCSLLSTIDSPSKNKESPKSFHCYQETLMSTITTLSNEHSSTVHESSDQLYLARMFPVLFQEFLGACKSWKLADVAKNHQKKSVKTDRSSRIQFQMFQVCVGSLRLLMSGDRVMDAHVLDNIQRMIATLLRFDIYRPTHDDTEASQYRFLDELVQALMDIENTHVLDFPWKMRVSVLSGLRHLILLDHRLVNNRLVELLALCLTYYGENGDVSLEAVKILVALADVYRQLRQQSDFLAAMADLVDRTSEDEQLTKRYGLLSEIVKHDLLVRSITEGIETCPFGQVEQVVSLYRSRIARSLQEYGKYGDGLPVLVHLLVQVLKGMRVEHDNASSVANMCGEIVGSLVIDLKDSSHDIIKRRARLPLCAWCIHLNVRAAFWMGRSEELHIPDSVLEESMSSENAKGMNDVQMDGQHDDSEELMLLFCHRLRELHSLIYESERPRTLEAGALEKATERLKDDAANVASCVATIADRRSDWSVLMRNSCFPFWVPYAESHHVDLFLKWLFRMFAEDERATDLQALYQDASFYEHPSLVSRFSLIAVQVTDELVQQSLTLERSDNTRAKDVEGHLDFLELHLLKAAVSIKIVNGIFSVGADIGYRLRDWDAVIIALRVDGQITPLFRKVNGTSLSRYVSELCVSLRYFVANTIASFTLDELPTVTQNLSPRQAKAHISIIVQSIGTDASDVLVASSGTLLGQLTRVLLSAEGGSLRSQVLFEIIDALPSRAFAVISRHILMALFNHYPREPQLMGDVFEHLWGMVGKLFADQIETKSSGDALMSPDLIYLFGDLIHYAIESNLQDRWSRSDIKSWLENLCISNLSKNPDGSAQYAVAQVVLADPGNEILRRVAGQVVASTRSEPILDAVFCRVIGKMNVDHLRASLEGLLEIAESPTRDATNQMRLIDMCLRGGDSENHFSLLNEYSSRILSAALSRLSANSCDEETKLACLSVLDELLCNRNVCTLGDTDLTRLLYHLITVLGPMGIRGDDTTTVSNRVFARSTKVYATVFLRYTKYLYACAPLVVLVVHAFLMRVLYEKGLSDADALDRGRSFARVCELFVGHKEIYKKHILGLILEYVRAVQNKLDLVRKRSLIPAVYHLIDALSSYELKQLNSLMDQNEKIMFKGVYQSYQKLHAYKGQ